MPCTLIFSILFYFSLINDGWNTLGWCQDLWISIAFEKLLNSITDAIVIFIWSFAFFISVWILYRRIGNHVNGAFGKKSKDRYNFVHHLHFAYKETEPKSQNIIRVKFQPFFLSRFSFYHIKWPDDAPAHFKPGPWVCQPQGLLRGSPPQATFSCSLGPAQTHLG